MTPFRSELVQNESILETRAKTRARAMAVLVFVPIGPAFPMAVLVKLEPAYRTMTGIVTKCRKFR